MTCVNLMIYKKKFAKFWNYLEMFGYTQRQKKKKKKKKYCQSIGKRLPLKSL